MRIDELPVKKGTDALFGPPPNPISQEATAAIGAAAASIRGVLEAHLPQCFVPGVSEAPAQLLVLVLARSANGAAVMRKLGPELTNIVPKGLYLDVWPLPPNHEVL